MTFIRSKPASGMQLCVNKSTLLRYKFGGVAFFLVCSIAVRVNDYQGQPRSVTNKATEKVWKIFVIDILLFFTYIDILKKNFCLKPSSDICTNNVKKTKQNKSTTTLNSNCFVV